jgi:hypothetical protein
MDSLSTPRRRWTAPEMVARIKELIGQHAAGAIEAHDVRTRHAGRMTFVEFHLVVPGDIRVAEAHEICDRIEAALKADMNGEALITIHVEPQDKAKLAGVPGALMRRLGPSQHVAPRTTVRPVWTSHSWSASAICRSLLAPTRLIRPLGRQNACGQSE